MPITERPLPRLADAAKYPFIVSCDKPECWFLVSAKTPDEAQEQLTSHRCPHRGGPTRQGLMVSRTILEEAWLKLDVCVTELYEGTYDADEVLRMKGVCRGMAEIIALFMLPYFTTGDEVTKEAVARYKAKKNGETDYETPGIGGRRFAPPPGTSAASKPQAAPRVTPSHKLKDNEVAAIKNAMASGMFTAADLARTYGVSAAVIEQIIAV